MTLQITRVRWRPERALREIDRASEDAEQAGGERLLEAANTRVPHRSGFLEESGTVTRTEEGVVVSYSAPYAPILRAHPDWDFLGGRSGRWFEEAIDDQADPIGGVIADTVEAGWPGGL